VAVGEGEGEGAEGVGGGEGGVGVLLGGGQAVVEVELEEGWLVRTGWGWVGCRVMSRAVMVVVSVVLVGVGENWTVRVTWMRGRVAARVEAVARKASRKGRIVGVMLEGWVVVSSSWE
jgi:hypothetical protein